MSRRHAGRRRPAGPRARNAGRALGLALALAAATLAPGRSAAHHGIIWYDADTVLVLEGFVSDALEKIPHWEFRIRADGVDWQVDLQDGFEMREAGLDEETEVFSVGRRIVVEGHPASDRDWKRIRPTRITIGGRTYVFDIKD